MGADISVESVAGKLNRSATKLSCRPCGRPRAPAIAMSNSPIGCSIFCRRTGRISRSPPTISSSTAPSCSPTRPRWSTASARTRRRCPASRTSVADALDRGWHYATLLFGETQIRTGHLLVGDAEVVGAEARADRRLAGIRQDSRSTNSPPAMARSGQDSEEGNLRPMDGSGVAAAEPADGRRRRWGPRARRRSTASARISPPRPRPARWTRSSAATTKSARSSTC